MSASADQRAGRVEPPDLFDRALRGMWVILLEIGLVVGLAAFIVWWTWPKKRAADSSEAKRESGESDR